MYLSAWQIFSFNVFVNIFVDFFRLFLFLFSIVNSCTKLKLSTEKLKVENERKAH